MRYDALGLWWAEADPKTEKMFNLLTDEGWVQVFPGYWAEEDRLYAGEDAELIMLPVVRAFQQAKAARSGAQKRIPPEPVWLSPDYLPGLQEALQFPVTLFTDSELVDLATEGWLGKPRHKLAYDVECYPNYFLVAFKSIELGKVIYFEKYLGQELNYAMLQWVLENFCVVGFGSLNYDTTMVILALAGLDNAALKDATVAIIEEGLHPWAVLKRYNAQKWYIDQIDIMEVAPLFGSLKIYGGRLHSRKMQDLPFPPETFLSQNQAAIVRYYCINDLDTTIDLYNELEKPLNLRQQLSGEYGIDLRSKSDAQIAEAVISAELEKRLGHRVRPPKIDPGTGYRYAAPGFLKFATPLMRSVLQYIEATPFIVSENGNIGIPPEISRFTNPGITIGNSVYRLGIGGLHSSEKCISHFANERYTMVDRDVASFYPRIILNLGIYPEHLGPEFLTVYEGIVTRRLAAKKAGDKVVSDSLKITINGSYGKLGSMYSKLYSPNLLITVTITGQLSLLLLIERLELAGINVVSANTDGLVIRCRNDLIPVMDEIVAQWEYDTGFETEDTKYRALYSRDVNNYIAIKDVPKDAEERVKTKGIFALPGLSKNPQNEICIEAAQNYLLDHIPIEESVYGCSDIRKFLNVRTVKGGAVKDGEYLGKAIRWYYSKSAGGEIVYAKSGNKVPKSDGARPLMELVNYLPADIDHQWYVRETIKLLKSTGAVV